MTIETYIDQLKHELKMNPQKHEIHSDIGIEYYKLNDFENALFHFKKAIRYDKNNFHTYHYLGNLYSKTSH